MKNKLLPLLLLLVVSVQAMESVKKRKIEKEQQQDDASLKNVAGSIPNPLMDVLKAFQQRQELKKKKVQLPNTVLLYGKSGVGKSLIIKEIANTLGASFFWYSGNDIVEQSLNQKRVVDFYALRDNVKDIFTSIEQLKKKRNAIAVVHMEYFNRVPYISNNNIVIPKLINEEIEALREKNKIDVLFVAEQIYSPARIPFTNIIEIPEPNHANREKILEYYLQQISIKKSQKVDLNRIAHQSQGLVGFDLKNIVNDAAARVHCKGEKEISEEDIICSLNARKKAYTPQKEAEKEDCCCSMMFA